VVDVYFTVDVEVWCDGWVDIDRKFPTAFERYIYGPDRQHGLPYQLDTLREFGLRGIFFVEPLFAGRFGLAPLAEVVELIESSGHETQLHLHTEWVDEATRPLLPSPRGKRQHLRYFDAAEQSILIAAGIDWLQRAGSPRPVAFRAGSFAFNQDTLPALIANKLQTDLSYNASMFGPTSGVCPGETLDQPRQLGDVLELPMTVYEDGRGLRHAQLTACSWSELEGLLWQALDAGHTSFVILSHGSELLAPGLSRADPVVVDRFDRLCRFLDRERTSFVVRGLRDGPPPRIPVTPVKRLRSPIWRTGLRMMEQVWRRRYT